MKPISMMEAVRAFISATNWHICSLCGGSDDGGHAAGCEKGTLLQVFRETKAIHSREAELSAEVMALREAAREALQVSRDPANHVTAMYIIESILSASLTPSAALPYAETVKAAERAVLCPEHSREESWMALMNAVRGLHEEGNENG